MKKIIYIPLFLLTLLSFTLKGQSSLGIDSSNYNIPPSVSYNAVYTFSVNVKNYGPQAFNGSFDLAYVVDSSGTFSSPDTSNSHFVFLNIPVNNEQPDTHSVVIDGKFKSGINTVVIWPKGGVNLITHDTLKVKITVTGVLNGIANYTQSNPIIFPNPVRNRLFITNRSSDFIIEQVRIWDISGNMIYNEIFKGSIDVNKLTSGFYTLELTDKVGKVSRYKIIKE
jgi:hypothetical protein